MTTVVLEGDGMEELLARVAAEHGEGARVVRAERVRVGGVGGFFARQRYEVVVEVDDEDGDDPAVDAAQAAASRTAGSRAADGPHSGVKVPRAAAEDTGERAGHVLAPAPRGPGDRAGSTTQDTAGDIAGQHQHGPQGRDHEETHVLGHSRGPAATAAEVPVPRATADSGRCEEVLGDIFDSPIARALVRGGVLDAGGSALVAGRTAARGGALDRLVDAADAGDDAAVGINGMNGTSVNGTGLNGAGLNGAGLNGSAVDGAGVNGRAGSRPRGRHAAPAEPLERGRPVSTESAAFAAVLDAVRGAAEPDPEAVPAPSAVAEPEVPAAQGPEPVAAGAAVAELMALLAARHVAEGTAPADSSVAQEQVHEQAPQQPGSQQRAAQQQAPQPVRREPAVAPVVPTRAPVGGETDTPRARAAAAGLPAPLLERLAVDATAGDLHELLEELPVAPSLPASEGDLVAVVGAPREALVVAKALATRLGLGPEGVLVAACPTGPSSPRREVVRDAVAARRAAATVRLGDAPGVVVVQVECDPESVRWARGVVSALQADQVHAVVDATRKSLDTERWLDGVFAEDPDAAHVVQAAGSGDPGTVLGFEVPVASVDGGDGGASAWTSLLTRALPEAAADEPLPPRRRRRAGR
ncbi:hypothetical protein [uncultured Pseudokineococcus sp.]|uniref:hypothetical protein n=1 Tax=uncultured Pseudokineococcus sp. TaxID=1642928 RepID=UPI00262D017D|nr:hypothetical protein [uncultured Pseudokineococcus sp.]